MQRIRRLRRTVLCLGTALFAQVGFINCVGQNSASPQTFGATAPSAGSSNSSPPTAASQSTNLAHALGLPSRLSIGLGIDDITEMGRQGLQADILDHYLVGVGPGSWPSWNLPAGSYIGIAAAQADAAHAVPMFTLYQMAQNGDGQISDINDVTFMSAYWSNVRLMFQQIAKFNKPVLVNLEPDFWGYAEQVAPQSDPSKLAAQVTLASECNGLSNDVRGIAGCLVRMARLYAPKAKIGFPPSDWGASSISSVAEFMSALGAPNADFVVMQTLDRDAGCFEAASEADCQRQGSFYWDESNLRHPNFQDHFANAKIYHDTLNLPMIWWQTPLGVPSNSFGSSQNWRDNRAHYFLTHPAELTAVGGFAVVFTPGSAGQTTITTDGGQFGRLATAYLAQPAPLQ